MRVTCLLLILIAFWACSPVRLPPSTPTVEAERAPGSPLIIFDDDEVLSGAPAPQPELPAQEATMVATLATPGIPLFCLWVNRNANLRSGPGLNYSIVGRLLRGECVVIIGRTEDGRWLQLIDGKWVAAFLVDTVGVLADIPVVAVPTP